jgi:hypothetical protein
MFHRDGKLGGSTEEAQKAIGLEVATTLIKYLNTGSTISAVNVPRVELRPLHGDTIRILNMHQNVPGVLKVRVVRFRHSVSCFFLFTHHLHLSYLIYIYIIYSNLIRSCVI